MFQVFVCARSVCICVPIQACGYKLSLNCACAHTAVTSGICVLSVIRVCQCILEEDQTPVSKNSRTPSSSAKSHSAPLIPHNPLCLQAGDTRLSVCVCTSVCVSLCQAVL